MSQRRNIQLAAAFGLACAALLALASRAYGLSWDESIYIEASLVLRRWAHGGFSFQPEVLHAAWNWQPVLNPHPPLLKILSALSSALLPGSFPFGFRLGPILLSAGFLGASFYLLASEFGAVCAATALGFALLQPRLLTVLLIGTNDGAIATGWLLMALLGWRCSLRSGRAAWISLYLVHALVTASKITGFLSIFPLLLFHALRRDARSFLRAAGAIPLSLFFLTVLAPPSWPKPWEAPLHFLAYPFTRSHVVSVATFYLSQVYGEYLPWHAFFVMLFSTLPPLLLALLLASPLALRDPIRRRLFLALLPYLSFWLVLGSLPSTPKHDGVRQFVALLPFLSLFAWLGAESLARNWPQLAIVRWIPLAVLAWNAGTVLRIHPFEQSYYNILVGGLPGAERAGLEIAYDFTALQPDAIEWLNAKLPQGAVISIRPDWQPVLQAYQIYGLLRPDFRIPTKVEGQSDAEVLLHRKSMVPEVTYAAASAEYEAEVEGVSVLKISVRR